jgi:type I restriction enzyme S subunit
LSHDQPEGWTVAKLGEVADVRLGRTPRRQDYRDEGRRRIVKFRDLKPSGLDFSVSRAGFVVDDPDVVHGLEPLKVGDVLLTASAHSGDSIGKKTVYVDSLPDGFDGIYFVGELLGVTANEDVLAPQWPYLWFRTHDGIEAIQDAVAGVHLTAGRAREIPIPLPPLREQRRIVAEVAEVEGQLAGVERRISAASNAVGASRAAVIKQAFFGRLVPTDADLAAQDGAEFEPAAAVLARVRDSAPQRVRRRRRRE